MVVLGALSPPAKAERPFLWTDGLRKGQTFADPRLPFRFVAPEDLVFRIWKEGSHHRLEARSYRGNSIYIAMTSMRYLRPVPLASLINDLSEGCDPDTIQIEERVDSVVVQCREDRQPESSIVRILKFHGDATQQRIGFVEIISQKGLQPVDLQLQ